MTISKNDVPQKTLDTALLCIIYIKKAHCYTRWMIYIKLLNVAHTIKIYINKADCYTKWMIDINLLSIAHTTIIYINQIYHYTRWMIDIKLLSTAHTTPKGNFSNQGLKQVVSDIGIPILDTLILVCPNLILSFLWCRLLSYRNQSIDLLWKSMEWFLYDNNLHHERIK